MNGEDAIQQYQEAERLWNEAHYAGALAIAEALLREFPDNADLVRLRARCDEAIAREHRTRIRRRRRAVVAVLIAAVAAALFAVSRPPKSREIPFPAEWSVGRVFVRDAGAPGGEWAELGEARGTLAVPAGATVRLELDASQTLARSVAAISKLPPDALQEIDAARLALDNEGLLAIARMKGLQSLDLEETPVDDVGLALLADLAGLKWLNLAKTRVGDTGMIWLSGLSNLEHLDLRGTAVTDAGIANLAKLGRLRSFFAPGAMTDAALGRISEMGDLDTLDLGHTGVTDRGLRRLKTLAKLRTLHLDATWTGDSGALQLADIASLENLYLAHTRITDEGARRLAALPALRELVLDGTGITDDAITQLSMSSTLTRLGLGACFDRPNLSNRSWELIAKMPALETLDISGAELDSNSITSLSALRVTSLALGDTRLDESALAGLRRNLPRCTVTATPRASSVRLSFPPDVDGATAWVRPSGSTADWALHGAARGRFELPPGMDLRLDVPLGRPDVLESLRAIPADRVTSLRVSKSSAITAEDMGPVASFARLEALEIFAPELSPGAISPLESLTRLNRLILASVHLDADALAALTRMTALEFLDLGRAGFDHEAWRNAGLAAPLRALSLEGVSLEEADAAFLRLSTNLAQLDIRETGLSGAAVTGIRDALANCAVRYSREPRRVIGLQHPASGTLWSRAPGSPSEAWQFAGAFPGELHVAEDAEIRVDADPGAGEFTWLAALAKEGIHTLNLAGTGIKDEHLALLAEYGALRSLDLHGTGVGDKELGRIAALAGLESLKLGSTKISDAGVASLAPLAALREVELSNTAVTGAGLMSLAALPALERVYAEGTAVAGDALAQVKAALPGREVFAANIQSAPAALRAVAPAARVLGLSAARPMGVVWMRDWKGGPWEEIGPLCCEMPVPAKKSLRLVVSLEAARDLAPLAQLPPATFDEIAFEPGAPIEEATLLALGVQTSLRKLSFPRAEIRPGALRHIQSFASLKELSLHDARLNPSDLAYLRWAPWIEEIDLGGVSLGDEELAHLGAISALKSVDMRDNAHCSDNALAHWDTLASLAQIDVSRTPMSDGVAARLEALPAVKILYAYSTQITPTGRERIAQMPLAEAEFDRARLTAADLDGMAPALARRVREAGGITRDSLAAMAKVSNVRDLDTASFLNLAGQTLRSLAREGIVVDAAAISEVAGEDSPGAVPDPLRPGLQRAALDAIAATGREISSEDLASISGTGTPADIPAPELDRLQRTALEAMADSAIPVTRDTITGLLGTSAVDSADSAAQDEVRTMVLSAMANSEQGITPDILAAVEGVVSSAEIVPERLAVLEEESLSAMAASDTGLTSTRLAALDGAATLDELSEERVGSLQTLALSAMAASDTGIDAKDLAAIGGADSIAEMAPTDLASLQQMALSAMSNSDTGITAENLAHLSGVDSLADLAAGTRTSLQGMALSAMADAGSITGDSIVAISGMGSVDAIPDAELKALQALTLSAMAGSETGLRPELIASFIGDAAIEDVTFADSPIGDSDLAMIPNLGALRRIDLTGCRNITDSALARLQDAKSIETLLLGGTRITNAGLALAGTMGTLRTLDVSRTAITDAGLVHLKGLAQLASLSLEGTDVSGAGLEPLRDLVALKTLDLRETFVWDRHLRHLGRMTSLETLRLAFAPVGDEGLASLDGLAGLRTLELHHCALVTDAGIAKLRALPGIAKLTLYGASVTDACAESIASISSLAQLVVGSTTFTPSVIANIESALPKCEVVAIPLPVLEPAILARMERGTSLRAAAIAATVAPPESFRNLSYPDMAARLAYAAAVAGAALLSLAVPFLPYLSRANLFGRSVRGIAIAVRILAQITRISAIVGYLLTQAGLYAFRWWILATVVAILAFLLYSGLDFGWLRLNDTLPVPVR